MAAIQVISARIGRVTGAMGSPPTSRRRYPRWVLLAIVGMLVGRKYAQYRRRPGRDGRGAAPALRRIGARLRDHLRAAHLLLQVFLPYRRYVRWLKWLTLALLAYVGSCSLWYLDLAEVLRGAFALSYPRGPTRTMRSS